MSEDLGGGGGGGGGVGAQNSILSVALPKKLSLAAIGFFGPLFLNSTNFILSLKLLIGFFLLTWWAMLKCISVSLKW